MKPRSILFLLAWAAPLCGQCTYAVSPAALSATAAGGGGTVNVNTGAQCAWTYSTGADWIALSAAGTAGTANNSVTGSGALSVTIAASTLPTARAGSILIQGGGFSQTVAVNQGAAVCSLTLQPVSGTLPAAGGTGGFGVQTSCSWAAATNTLWIALASPLASAVTGTGNGTVNFTAAPNPCVDTRTGTIVVAGQPNQSYTLTESGAPGNLSLSPATLSAPQAGISGRFNVITGDPCAWTAFSDQGWIHINTASTGTGNGGIGYTIDANPGAQRTGNIHVGAQLFAVTQTGVAPPAVTLMAVQNAASAAFGTVAPGEIVSLFGTNIGPAVAVPLQLSADGKSISSALGGVQVLFDGSPAALIYVSAGQINAIAPVGLAGKSSTQVTVQYQGASSNTMTIPVTATATGIFAYDGSGQGGGAILNQDGSVNVRLNPAKRASVIAIFLTGAGVTTPASVDGAVTGVAPPFPAVAVPVTVTIGGVAVPAAQVVYSGAAPGSVEGLIQVDAVVPSNIATGPSVPVVVTIGGVASQPGITVSVN